ncbi:hypothetical protein BU23DRAFT_575066 [Bimuria novae-zelandiae CBS 107.79]|uniref:Mid2 domain-containing protein n=1 Tax=Bimuria novae-zelandiae CBS 107.79 TaxID=1447943 RepID=A0A6A5UMV2_9PLEO|nr:hypothetical protein BU23DRAFT_575066 [Bimuria novae-zelandiae CBS 107.79]
MPRVCYTAKDQLAPSFLMPCFRGVVDDLDVYGCCIVGDYCLANQACYDPEKNITYQKGCTHKDYNDISCPRKCVSDQSKSDWVGLVFCNGTNNTPKDTWVCNHPDNCKRASNCPADGSQQWDEQLEVTARTDCEDIQHEGQWVAFSGRKPLMSTAKLPEVNEASVISWWSAHSNFSTRWVITRTYSDPNPDPYAPTGSTTDTADTSLKLTEASTAEHTQPSLTSNASIDWTHKTPSSRGPNLGLAVGLGAGIPILLAGVGFLMYYLRKRHNEDSAREQSGSQLGGSQSDGTGAEGKTVESSGEAYGYSTKAELPAEERPRATHISKMEGSNVGELTPKQSPMASTLFQKDPSKENVQHHRASGVDNSPVYELPG